MHAVAEVGYVEKEALAAQGVAAVVDIVVIEPIDVAHGECLRRHCRRFEEEVAVQFGGCAFAELQVEGVHAVAEVGYVEKEALAAQGVAAVVGVVVVEPIVVAHGERSAAGLSHLEEEKRARHRVAACGVAQMQK